MMNLIKEITAGVSTWLNDIPRLTPIIIVVLITLFYKLLDISGRKLPPGPLTLPFFGHLLFLGRKPHIKFEEYRRKYGDIFSVNLGMKHAVILGNFIDVKKAFNMEELLERPAELFSVSKEFKLLTEEKGEETKIRRQNFASRVRAASPYNNEEVVQHEICLCLEKLQNVKESLDVDIRDLLSPITISLSLSIAVGNGIHSEQMCNLMSDFLSSAAPFFLTKCISLCLRIPEFLCSLLPSVRHGYTTFAKMDALVRSEIKARRLDQSYLNPKDFLDFSLFELDRSPKSRKLRNDNDLRGDAQLLLFSAAESIRATTEWILLILAKHQDIQDTVYAEISSVLGTKTPSWSDRRKLPLTLATIIEVQRFITIGPLSAMRVPQKDIKFNGYEIAKGTWMIANVWAVHNDPKLWENPSEFNPLRFLNEDSTKVVVPEFWIPYSLGLRNCLGDKIAKMTLFLLTVSIIQNFRVLPSSKGISLKGTTGPMFASIHHFVRFARR